MEIYVLFALTTLCLILMAIFINYRVKIGGIAGLLTKALASFGFVAMAIFLTFTKAQASYYARIGACFIILGLICGLIGDILLDLKVMYPFHEEKYLKSGMVSFGVGHVFYIVSLILLTFVQADLFSKWLHLILLIVGSFVASMLVWLVSKKALHLNFGKTALITNAYSFILILVTAFSIYLCFVDVGLKMYIIAIGFVLFLASDLVLSTQYFGGKQESKGLTVINHLLYYFAQIIIATFIYFI